MRRRSPCLVWVLLLLLIVAGPSFAARRSSLAGNLLVQDADDMFFFPQLVSAHKRMVTFDFGPGSGLGSGGMVLGTEGLGLGLFAHRSEFLGALGDAFFTRGDIDAMGGAGADSSLGALDIGLGPSAFNWIDLLAGWQLGGNPWGVRLSLGRDDSDPPREDVRQDVTAFNLVVGTRLERWNADLGLELALAAADLEDSIATRETTPWHVGLGVRRTAAGESDAVRVGWLGLVSWTSGSADSTPRGSGSTTTATDAWALDLVAGIGPVYEPSERTHVAMYGTLQYRYRKSESPAATVTEARTVVPGWNVAAEVPVASWLQLRAGLRSEFAFLDTGHETPSSDTHDRRNSLAYDWTAGIGIQRGNFTFDGYLDPSVLTTGTDLLGTGDTLFGMVTTTFRF